MRRTGANGSCLLRVDVGHPDHLAPFFGFLRDELFEIGGRVPLRGFSSIPLAKTQRCSQKENDDGCRPPSTTDRLWHFSEVS